MVKAVNSLPSTKADGMLAELLMYVGMPVMLTKNISTELGLTNGTKGIIKMIPLKENEKCNQSDKGFKKVSSLDYIIIEVPDASISDLDGLPKNHIPIFRCKSSFVLKQNNDVMIKRDHFPIVPAFSCTAHKSQGQTLKKIIIDLVPPKGMKIIDTSFAYVPLSRVSTLQDLNILRPLSSNVSAMGVNTDCGEMMKDFEQRNLCKDI